jgi:hypothetical protein
MPTIFDNVDEFFADYLQVSLSASYRADFCVGYFNLRGWKNLSKQIDEFEFTLSMPKPLLMK